MVSVLEAFAHGRVDPRMLSGATRSVRDLTVVELSEQLWLVIACDSVGAIGSKEHDAYAVEADVAGYFALRVPLAELLASGAEPAIIVDTLTVERSPTGDRIIAGMRRLAAEIGLANPEALTGSTEDNVPTSSTGIGVTVIGFVSPDRFRPGAARAGDTLAIVGMPKSAPAHTVWIGDPDQVSLAALKALGPESGVHDIVPVGSRGAAHEVAQLADGAGLEAVLNSSAAAVDLEASGGPATCAVVAIAPTAVGRLTRTMSPAPLMPIGHLR